MNKIIIWLTRVIDFLTKIGLLVVGFAMAYISYTIEVEILTGLFPTSVVSFAILAGAFEVGKIGLIMLKKTISPINNLGYNTIQTVWPYRIVVTTSVLCSFCYCLWQTCSPEKDAIIEDGSNKIEVQFQADLKKLHAHFDNAMKTESNQLMAKIAVHDSIIKAERFYTDLNGIFKKERFNFSYEESEKYTRKLEGLPEKYQAMKNKSYDTLLAKRDKQIIALETESENFESSGNKVVLYILKTINLGSSDFYNWQYVGLVLLISLVLTGALESLIIISFGFVALGVGKEFEMHLRGERVQRISFNFFEFLQSAIKKARRYKNNAFRVLTNDMIKEADHYMNEVMESIKTHLNNNKIVKDGNE